MTEQELILLKDITDKNCDMFAQAELMQKLCVEWGYAQSSLAARLHISQSSVGNKIRLLQYSQQERERILYYQLSERHARALLRILPPKRVKLIETAGQMRLTVQQTEDLVEKYRSGAISELSTNESDQRVANIASFTDYIAVATNKLRNFGYHVSCLTESGDRWQRITIIVRE